MELIIIIICLSAVLCLIEIFTVNIVSLKSFTYFISIIKKIISAGILTLILAYLIINYLTVALIIMLIAFVAITTNQFNNSENTTDRLVPFVITLGLFVLVVLRIFSLI